MCAATLNTPTQVKSPLGANHRSRDIAKCHVEKCAQGDGGSKSNVVDGHVGLLVIIDEVQPGGFQPVLVNPKPPQHPRTHQPLNASLPQRVLCCK